METVTLHIQSFFCLLLSILLKLLNQHFDPRPFSHSFIRFSRYHVLFLCIFVVTCFKHFSFIKHLACLRSGFSDSLIYFFINPYAITYLRSSCTYHHTQMVPPLTHFLSPYSYLPVFSDLSPSHWPSTINGIFVPFQNRS